MPVHLKFEIGNRRRSSTGLTLVELLVVIGSFQYLISASQTSRATIARLGVRRQLISVPPI